MRTTFLPFALPAIDEDDVAEVATTLRSLWITTGPRVRRFEEEFAAFVGARAALAVNSCTAALHLALVALGVGPGDAVVASPLTFCSTVHVIEHVGAHPILVDVERDTLNMAPEQLEAALAGTRHEGDRAWRAKVVLPTHLYGHPCDLDAIRQIARDGELAILEDAAHALPAKHGGQSIGAWTRSSVPTMSAFSFYATKNLATAEGGMLVGPPELVEQARIWSLHGMSRDAWKRYSSEGSWYYEVVCPGFKYNMTDIQASLGLHQLRKLPGLQARRQEIARRYDEVFSRLEEIETPVVRPGIEHAWHLYVVRLNTERLRFPGSEPTPHATRHRFIEELRDRKIGSSVHFIPIHLHPYYREKYGYAPHDFPVAYEQYQRLVSVPFYPTMSDGDVDDVIEAVTDIVRRYRA